MFDSLTINNSSQLFPGDIITYENITNFVTYYFKNITEDKNNISNTNYLVNKFLSFIIGNIKKSFIKSLLKYHKSSYELKNQIRNDVLVQLKISQDMIKTADIMQPEFMFHLPGDVSEEGSYHIDSLVKIL